MKQAATAKSITFGNEAYALSLAKAKEVAPDVAAMLLYIGQVCDHLSKGGDAFITFGANRARTRLLLTVGVDGQKEWLDAGSLLELLNHFQTLL